MSTKNQLFLPNQGISCHAWNKDKTMIAVCPNNNEVHIFDTRSQPWSKLHVLTEHDMLISSIDWSDTTGRIVTCAHDRNAFVWTFDAKSNSWKPALAITRIERSALDVKWSADGKRFAIASGAKCVSVCSYVEENDWWTAKIIKKKIKSTVLCCAFHPINSQILAAGSSDFRARVYSTFDSALDSDPISAPFASPIEFGELYAEITLKAWINSVAWTPSGNKLAVAGHDSTLTISTFANGELVPVQSLNLSILPFMKIACLTDSLIIGVGHEFKPAIIKQQSENDWAFHDFIDKKKEEEAKAATGVSAARALFQNKTSRGQETKTESDVLWTQHESCVSDLKVAGFARGVTSISTSSMDGRVVVWNLQELGVSLD